MPTLLSALRVVDRGLVLDPRVEVSGSHEFAPLLLAVAVATKCCWLLNIDREIAANNRNN